MMDSAEICLPGSAPVYLAAWVEGPQFTFPYIKIQIQIQIKTQIQTQIQTEIQIWIQIQIQKLEIQNILVLPPFWSKIHQSCCAFFAYHVDITKLKSFCSISCSTLQIVLKLCLNYSHMEYKIRKCSDATVLTYKMYSNFHNVFSPQNVFWLPKCILTSKMYFNF